MSVTVDLLITRFLSQNGDALEAQYKRLSKEANQYGEAQSRAISRSVTVGSASMATLLATSKIISQSLEKAGEAQATKTGFTTLLGDAKKADDLFNKLQKFAIQTPFDDAETKKLASFLLATGTRADQVIDRMHAMGNAVSAAGKGQNELSGVVMAMSALQNSTIASRQQIKRLEIRGIQANKILQQELGLSADQVQNLGAQMLKGSVVADALYRGMEKVGGGKAMENMVGTLPGQLATLEDAKNQLLTAVGTPLLGDATKLVHLLAEGATYMRDMAQAHPQLTKGLAEGAIATSIGGVGYGTLQGLKLARDARIALQKAVKSDTAAEKIKEGVANSESKAIGKGAKASELAADAKGKLKTATERAAAANRKSAAEALEKAAATEAEKEAVKEGAKEAEKSVSKIARLRGLLGKEAFNLGEGGRLEQMSSRAVGSRSFGQVGLGAAAGAAVGYGFYDSYSSHENQSAMRAYGVNVSDDGAKFGGAAAGVLVGALAIAAPEIALPIIAAVAAIKGAEYVVNKKINEPQEKAATTGSGAEAYGADMASRLAAAQKNRDFKAESEIYDEMSKKAAAAGDKQSAGSFALQSTTAKNKAERSKTYGTEEYWASALAPRQADPRIKAEFDRAQREIDGRPPMQLPDLGPYGVYGAPYDPRQGASNQGPIQLTAQPRGRRVGNQFEVSFGTIRFDDPAGDQARKQADASTRNAYG